MVRGWLASSHRSRSTPAASAASARAKPHALKPSRSASALIASSRLSLLATVVHYSVRPELVEGSPLNFLGKAVLPQAQHERFQGRNAVEAIDLVKDFGTTRAVDGVSLSVPSGSIYGLLGPNGAGKTTTLRMLLGIIDPSNGTRSVLGRERPIDAARLWQRIAIIAKGKVGFEGRVDDARARLRPIVRLRTRASDGPWRSVIPADARQEGEHIVFELPESGPEPLLRALLDGGAGIEALAIERPGLHDAFVAIAGESAAAAMVEEKPQ